MLTTADVDDQGVDLRAVLQVVAVLPGCSPPLCGAGILQPPSASCGPTRESTVCALGLNPLPMSDGRLQDQTARVTIYVIHADG